MRETDHLTGLWSRQHFYKIAVMEHERALRYEHPIALLLFDIAHFKDTNDRYDEFVVLMPMGTLETANQVAERIRLALQNHVFAHDLRLSIRCGMGEWALQQETVDDLLARVGREMR